MDTLAQLTRYTQWANRTWLTFIAAQAPDDAYFLKMIGHLAQGERAWFQRLLSEPLHRDVWAALTLDETRALFDANDTAYAKLLAEDRSRKIKFVRNTGVAGAASVEEILLHLCTHGSHHRGQMATHAAREKLVAPNTDFVAFVINSGGTKI